MANSPTPASGGRLEVLKTYKLFIGGAFPRSESGKVMAVRSPSGRHLANVSKASKKDFRDAVTAARSTFPKWSKATAYLRGQILYRAAEILEQRAAELTAEVARSTAATPAQAATEVASAVECLVHHAGWTDKFGPVFGSVNPVASPHFNFTIPEPTGVVVIFCPPVPSLLAMVHLLSGVILTGNTAIVLPSEPHPLPALTFAEILATSDLPGGTVNILSGIQAEIAPHAASHMDVNAIVDGSDDPALHAGLQGGSAFNLKRYARHGKPAEGWSADGNPYRILDTIEFKTAWHPVGY